MGHTPHELAEEFPGHVEAIHNLKDINSHFARLVDEYHNINRAIHRAETNVTPTDDFNEAAMRKKRLTLKDEIWRALQAS